MSTFPELPPAAVLAERVRRGLVSPRELVDDALARIAARNDAVNAFIHVDDELAREAAADVERRLRDDDDMPLAGVPIGVKDSEDVRGMPTAYGSLLYRGRPAMERDSLNVARLRAAGAVPVGKTAMPEFGADTATLSPGWGVTRNPWNPGRTPGGSSGGSAAAVAAGMVALATGADSGGSVRGPAAYCGLVGLKPTSGLVPWPGAGPSNMLAHGALVSTVTDAAIHLDIVNGPDAADPISAQRYPGSFEADLLAVMPRDLRFGWSPDLGFAVVDRATNAVSLTAAIELSSACGASLREVRVDWPNPEDIWWESAILDSWRLLQPGMWPDRQNELSPVARNLFAQTASLTPPEISALLGRRQQLVEAVAATFADLDVLLTPTMASAPFPADESVPTVVCGIEMPDGAEPFTAFANAAGLPAISVPAGFSVDGMPLGLQIVGSRFSDALVLRLAAVVEQIRPWPRLAPWPPQR